MPRVFRYARSALPLWGTPLAVPEAKPERIHRVFGPCSDRVRTVCVTVAR
jgi:hypothetical protein